jgi:hypothetical protein
MFTKTNTALLIFIKFILLIMSFNINAMERRRDQYGKEFSYYLYPIGGDIPGLGQAFGVGGSALNIAETDTDFVGYYIRGDFNATGVTLLDIQLIKQRLIFDIGYNDFLVAPIVYNRGIKSNPEDFIQPKVQGAYVLGQLTLSFNERQYEYFYRHLRGYNQLLQILNNKGEEFDLENTDRETILSHSIGTSVDLTDDKLDPRQGVRFEVAAKLPLSRDDLYSEYLVMDYNLTTYIPTRKQDTLVFNLFHSHAYVTRRGSTDFDTLKKEIGLNCNERAPGEDQENCLATEKDNIDQEIETNRYGIATPLGGTQRLRSFDNGRYYAGQSLSYGIEYRWNITDEYTPFNIYVAKGVRTGLQVAAFWEQGSVGDHFKDLFKTRRTSYGLGFRLLLTGVVIRADFARGNEGNEFQLFITYPWSMFSVDNPG